MINLMPPKLKESVKYGSYNVNIIQYIILVIVAGIALAAVIDFGVRIVKTDESKLNSSIAAKQQQLKNYSGDIEAAKALSDKIDTVDVLLDNEVKFSELIQNIGGLFPPGASITNLYLTNDLSENIILEARTTTKTVATELQQNLLNSDLFDGADIQSLGLIEGTNNYKVVIIVSYAQEAGGQK